MSDTNTTTTDTFIGTTYYSLARIGYWCHLDAECKRKIDPEFPYFVSNNVTFAMVNSYGTVVNLGFSIITTTDDGKVWDEDGEEFPTLDAAIRAHADHLTTITPLPAVPTATPASHATWQGTMAAAFDRSTLPNRLAHE